MTDSIVVSEVGRTYVCRTKRGRKVCGLWGISCPVETCWHTVTHGNGIEGEIGEWSG